MPLSLEESRFVAATADLRRTPPNASQLGQDRWALFESGRKRGGYFVEFGACDGLILSNTALLEQEFGWHGIVAEPNPRWHKALLRNRYCSVDLRCVSSESGLTEAFSATLYAELGGMTRTLAQDGNTPARQAKTDIEVETVSLADLLREHRAPHEIDFLSVDTEGSEVEILTAFFEEDHPWRFRMIAVEHNGTAARERLHGLLTGAGYVRKFEAISAHDSWYLRAD